MNAYTHKYELVNMSNYFQLYYITVRDTATYFFILRDKNKLFNFSTDFHLVRTKLSPPCLLKNKRIRKLMFHIF